MGRIRFVLFLLLISAGISEAQVNRYMIFFADKTGNGHTVDHPETFLNERSVQRRINQDIDVIAEDLPVTASYIQQVRATGATVLYKTKWMNGALIECTNAQLAAVNGLTFVKAADTELVAPGGSGSKQRKSIKFGFSSTADDMTQGQLAMLGIDEMHADGYHGEGVIVAIMDGGFSGVNTQAPFHEIFNNRIDQNVSWNFVTNTSNVYQASSHGTQVLSVLGVQATVGADEFSAGAYKATFQLYVTENIPTEYRIEEYNWLFAAERADSAGVDVINTSLGYNTFDDSSMDYEKSDMDGATAVITRAAVIAASKGIFLVNSAGNSGTDPSWQIITAPADAEDVLSVGNINLQGQRNPNSSIGPSADGRIKPDVVALGTGVTVIGSNGAIASNNGTSFSSPLTAGLVVGLRQRYPDLTRAELMEAIRMSASQAASPDNQLGYGIPHYRAVVNYLEVTSVEPEENHSLVIYPNPVQDTFTIAPRKPSLVQLNQVAIVNAHGQVVANNHMEYNWPDNSYSLNIGNFLPGVYFLTVRIGSRYETYKLIKI
ncbi:MAG TPA: S8/S53 family peptidase [Cyclobacteriaceae bacterium]|nr:S8 family peptidase [Cyclobacteriaceae bacterium]HMV10998.1 S8/S53 family peptidase [Cyclobacteriaceae bacterium]HMV91374.1 S8/S53 family peptidase [Cyclobacteriaceae bacterium]HMX01837.1 S8/S53 family peptidase [Cyclobacteriaceae bacterium]HMX52174.1 S8/S53 family peptidase [Cyclobacteriaceae bacterium]